jgi:hypothetical protein
MKKIVIIAILVVAITIVFLIQSYSAYEHKSDDNEISVSATQALIHPEKVILYAIGDRSSSTDGLEGYIILRQITLEPKEASIATKAVQDAISIGKHAHVAECFNPAHAVRVISENHTYDFIICYKCHQLLAYTDGKSSKWLRAAGSSEALDNLLKAAGVPPSSP